MKDSAVNGGVVINNAVGYWCQTLIVGSVVTPSVRIMVGADGRIARVELGAPKPGDIVLSTVIPGMGNAHSHAFHRMLRGRTHGNGGDFWRWRDSMYSAASRLTPARYFEVARAVFAEMLVCGYTAVGEFHYLHHQADGTAYDEPHAMERTIAAAARAVGIRLVLLDTAYLAGGIGRPLEPAQRAFDDGSAAGWLTRWSSLNECLSQDGVRIAAAIHSVRAVPADDIRQIVNELPSSTPLHIHISEQPQENADSLAAYHLTPTALLKSLGALTQRLALVHATHLTKQDIDLIGAAGATVAICPTTEADLGDGIGPARLLADAGARIALGSDQNAVIDPFLEMRGLEAGERLASGERGRFSPGELLTAATDGGYAALGLGPNRLSVGNFCDLVEVSTSSIRTAGGSAAQLPLTATATDVLRVIIGGREVARNGLLVLQDGSVLDPAVLLQTALEQTGERA